MSTFRQSQLVRRVSASLGKLKVSRVLVLVVAMLIALHVVLLAAGRHDTIPGGAAINEAIKDLTQAVFGGKQLTIEDVVGERLRQELRPDVHPPIVDNAESRKLVLTRTNPADKSGARRRSGMKFFEEHLAALAAAAPKTGALGEYHLDLRIESPGYDAIQKYELTEEYLGKFLKVSQKDVDLLKALHEQAVALLPRRAPSGLYKGNGYVYVGGGKFSWLALLLIKKLRLVGAVLPVEVLIPSPEEFEADFCGRVLPALNARCILLQELLGKSVYDLYTFKGYQYKLLALLVLLFQNVMMLDADNFPLHNPDPYFTLKVFKEHGLITWPDFWKRTTLTKFYEVAGIKVDTTKRVRYGYHHYGEYPKEIKGVVDGSVKPKEIPFHDFEGAMPNPLCELGQVMLLKGSHLRELWLAFYYNLYGPLHYYPLFLQGVAGEGDKETFLAATVALGEHKFYQVLRFVRALGNHKDGHYHGTAMGQYDLLEDYDLHQKQPKPVWLKQRNMEIKDARLMFVHANFPKLHPWNLAQAKELLDSEGERIRLYGFDALLSLQTGSDVEMEMYRTMRLLLCDLSLEMATFKHIPRRDLCQEITAQIEYYVESSLQMSSD